MTFRQAWPPLTSYALERDPRAHSEAFVYFILAPDQGYVKIGWTADPAERLRQLQRWSPAPLRFATCLGGGQLLERELHRFFAADRVHGEWFRLTARLRDLIQDARDVIATSQEAAA